MLGTLLFSVLIIKKKRNIVSIKNRIIEEIATVYHPEILNITQHTHTVEMLISAA